MFKNKKQKNNLACNADLGLAVVLSAPRTAFLAYFQPAGASRSPQRSRSRNQHFDGNGVTWISGILRNSDVTPHSIHASMVVPHSIYASMVVPHYIYIYIYASMVVHRCIYASMAVPPMLSMQAWLFPMLAVSEDIGIIPSPEVSNRKRYPTFGGWDTQSSRAVSKLGIPRAYRRPAQCAPREGGSLGINPSRNKLKFF
jgi:hypothetical protein